MPLQRPTMSRFQILSMLLILTLIVQTVPLHAWAAAHPTTPSASTTDPSALINATNASACTLYPIALHIESLARVEVGETIADVFNGAQPGSFGWLNWTGRPDAATLAHSLIPPGNSDTYINPNHPADHLLSRGDWVHGTPGVSNSRAIRQALDSLLTQDITVPVWDTATGHGNKTLYHVVSFARVRLVHYQLTPGQRISARFLGKVSCRDVVPSPTARPTTTSTPTSTTTQIPTLTSTTTSTSTPEPTSTPTTTPPATATPSPTISPTETPTATPTALPTPTATPNPLDGATITLAPSSAGPNLTGTSQQLHATLRDRVGVPIKDVAVRFTVDGPNATGSSATTDEAGIATWSYVGQANGTDTVQAQAAIGTIQLDSAVARIGWVTPIQPITSSTIWGRFFFADGSGSFKATPDRQPVFDQAFPTINFNPPAGSVPDNTSGVAPGTTPFTNITTDINGRYSGMIVAQDNGYQAGNGRLYSFDAVFTSTFVVAAAGDITFRFYHDDGFVLGIGGGATRVSGANENPPPSGRTSFLSLPVMGAYNRVTAPVGSTVTVHFPAPGTYPYEVDYSQGPCCHTSLTMTTDLTGFTGVPPSGALTLSPATVSAQPTGQERTFSVTATDASGIVLPSLPVTLSVRGANAQHLQAITDATGTATLSYTGQNWGTDSVEAIAWMRGMAVYSAVVTVQWTEGAPPVSDAPLAMPGWISSPANQSVVSGHVPITLAAGVALASGSIEYWPADNPAAVTVLAPLVQGSAGDTLATLDTTQLANGSYVIRLRGADARGPQVTSGVLITVAGEYKPGRVQFSVRDIVVPLLGLSITIDRTYDSLERMRSSDFGYGWSLSLGSPRLEVDPAHNVTLTQPNGRRVTFFFTPRPTKGVFGFLLTPQYTPEAGVYGSLRADGCELMVASGGQYICFLDAPDYTPTTYTYTDPYGRVYVIGADGHLRSLRDRNDTMLTFSRDGVTSNVDQRSVRFVRDPGHEHRISAIQVHDRTGAIISTYAYAYTPAGDLDTVTYPASAPGQPQPVTHYAYDRTHAHLYRSTIDPLGHLISQSSYYTSPGDPPDLNGRLKGVTNWVDATTSYTFHYSYDLSQNTITLINPDGGRVLDRYLAKHLPDAARDTTTIKLASATIDVRVEDGQTKTSTTRYTYDDALNVIAVGLPDPETGMAAPPSNDPGSCAPRNRCYQYDDQGNQTQIINPVGLITTKTYNEQQHPLSITLPSGTVQTFTYDRHGNFTSASDDLGLVGGYSYDAYGNPQTRYLGDDPDQAMRYLYDDYGNLKTTTDPLGHITHYDGYDAFGRVSTSTEVDPDGPTHVTQYSYDDLGRPLRVARPLNDGSGTTHATLYDYDIKGRQTLEQDTQTGWTTRFAYDYADQLTTQTNPDGTTLHYTYDWRGHIATTTDQAGHVTRHTYDLAGNLIRTTTADGTSEAAITAFSYDLAGRKTREVDPRGYTLDMQYDAADRVRFVVDTTHGAAHPSEFRYNDAGRIDLQIDPQGVQTKYLYDARGFATEIIYAYGTARARTERSEPDSRGNVVRHVNGNGHATTYIYDANGRVESVTDPLGHQTRYSLDRFGFVRTIIDANGHHTGFTYDTLGRVTEKVWPDQSRERFTYDVVPGSTPASTTQRVGHQLTDGHTNIAIFDAAGRMISGHYFDGQAVQYRYTPTGQPEEIQDQRGTTCYRYDSYDQLIEMSQLGLDPEARCGTSPSQARIAYTYDTVGHRTQMTATVGTTTTARSYAYDDANRLCSISITTTPTPCGLTNGSTYAYRYDTEARTQTLTYPNGIVATTTFDLLKQLQHMQYTRGADVLADYRYTLDAVGNRIQLNEADGAVTNWTYDDANRLVHEQRQAQAGKPATDSWDVHYTYDAVGNRQTMTETTPTGPTLTQYTYAANGLDQISAVTLPDGRTLPFRYDRRGNLLSDGTATYTYDAADRLRSVDHDGHRYRYRYDAAGRRFQQTADDMLTQYLWDEASAYGDVVAAYDSTDDLQHSYVIDNSGVLAHITAGGASTLIRDGQRNTRALADAQGTLNGSIVYDAFGMARSRSDSVPTSYLYTGQQFDATTGLYQLRARAYSPTTGRFLSRDSYYGSLTDPHELNRYVYTANNPINAFDPTGMFAEYAASQQENEDQAEDHANYINGHAFAKDQDKVALHQQAIFAAVVDSIDMMMLKAFRNRLFDTSAHPERPYHFTLGLGTVLSLRSGRLQTGVSLIRFRWDDLGRLLDFPSGMLDVAIIALLAAEGREPIIISRAKVAGVPESAHAEEILVQWAIERYGRGAPTPYRLLDVVTTIGPCNTCLGSVPGLMRGGQNPLLFEATIFASWPTRIPQPSMPGLP